MKPDGKMCRESTFDLCAVIVLSDELRRDLEELEAMSTAEERIREQAIVFLLFLTSKESLKACHKFITPEKLALKLARMWFDEIYVPGVRYLDGGLRGEYFEEEVERFQHSFTEDELEALRRFHRFFELRLAMIPASSRESEEWPQNDSWSNVVKDARNLLNLFSIDGDSLRSEVFEMFMQTLRTSLDRPDLREVFARKNLTASLYPSS